MCSRSCDALALAHWGRPDQGSAAFPQRAGAAQSRPRRPRSIWSSATDCVRCLSRTAARSARLSPRLAARAPRGTRGRPAGQDGDYLGRGAIGLRRATLNDCGQPNDSWGSGCLSTSAIVRTLSSSGTDSAGGETTGWLRTPSGSPSLVRWKGRRVRTPERRWDWPRRSGLLCARRPGEGRLACRPPRETIMGGRRG